MFGKIERNFRHEPLEVFAVKFLANSQLLADVSRVDAAVGRSTFVDVLGVFVHPHIGHTTIVLHKTMTIEKIVTAKTVSAYSSDEISNSRVWKWCELAINVTDTRAWRIKHHTATLPQLQ